MNELLILDTSSELIRAVSPMQDFLNQLHAIITNVLQLVKVSIIQNGIMVEPLLLFPIGFIAIMGAIGIFKRMLSRD